VVPFNLVTLRRFRSPTIKFEVFDQGRHNLVSVQGVVAVARQARVAEFADGWAVIFESPLDFRR
jgi:hypothetical protein